MGLLPAPGKSFGEHMGSGKKVPWSTFTGLMALQLAQEGFTCPGDILNHPACDDTNRILRGLGKTFAIEKAYLKPYSCCRWPLSTQRTGGFQQAHAECGIDAREISRRKMQTFSRALGLDNDGDPDSIESAQYSIPFSRPSAVNRPFFH